MVYGDYDDLRSEERHVRETIERHLGVNYRTGLAHVAHRIREAMQDDGDLLNRRGGN